MGDLSSRLDDLFKQFASPVVAVRNDRVVYANAAADTFFSGSVISRHPQDLFRMWPYPDGSAVSETVDGRGCLLTISTLNRSTVVTIEEAEKVNSTVNIPASVMSYLIANANTVRMGLDVIQKKLLGSIDGRTAMYFSAMSQSCCRLQRAADNLSTLAALGDNSYPFCPRPTEIGAFLSDVVSSARDLSRDLGIEISYSPPDKLVSAVCDGDLLEKLVFALLSNSLEHCSAGGHIRVALSDYGDNVVISVDDDGEGMSAQALSQAFRMSPVTDSLGIPGAHSKLGLPLCSAIASRHGGTVIIESREGEGCSVRVLLKADRPSGLVLRTTPIVRSGQHIPARALVELSSAIKREHYLPFDPEL